MVLSGCVFFIWLFAWPSIDVYGNGLNTLGGVVAGSAVAVTNLKICLEARYWYIHYQDIIILL